MSRVLAPTSKPQIVWRDPPPPSAGSNRSTYAPILAELMQRPGTWALINTHTSPKTSWSAATRLRSLYPGFEFAGRSKPGGGGELYARYLGCTNGCAS